jgi:hypothetical protein
MRRREKAGWWLAVVLLSLPVAVRSAETATDEEQRWGLEVALPFWFFAQQGTLTVRGREADVDVSIKDGLDLMTGGNAFLGAGFFEGRYDRFGFYVDAFGGYAEDRVAATGTGPRGRLSASLDAKLKIKMAFVDFAANYRLGQWTVPQRDRPLTLDVIAGGRYYFLDNRLRAAPGLRGQNFIFGRQVAADGIFDWADPLIGVRWEAPLLDPLSLDFRGDIGGFGVGSELSWSLIGELRYWLPWHLGEAQPWIGAGYKVLAFDREESSGNEADLQFRGPLASAGVRF